MIVIQNDQFSETNSITVCGLTTHETDVPFVRFLIEPSPSNGLRSSSRVMVDKIASVPKAKLGYCIGRLDDDDLRRLNVHLKTFLALSD
jgi:mRNA interferase MazF